MSVEETVEKIHDLGGIAVAAHPFRIFPIETYLREKCLKTDAIEIFNSGNNFTFTNKKAEEFSKKHMMPVCAGSDSHCTLSLGAAGIICNGDPIEDIMKKRVKIFGKKYSTLIKAYVVFMNISERIGIKRK